MKDENIKYKSKLRGKNEPRAIHEMGESQMVKNLLSEKNYDSQGSYKRRIWLCGMHIDTE